MTAVILSGFLGSLAAGLATAVGALPIYLRSRWGAHSRAFMLAFAGGVMLGATVFPLLVPALQMQTAGDGDAVRAALVVAAGVLLGAAVIWAVHAMLPHEHFEKGREGPAAAHMSRTMLFVIAITLHNIPEGMSVGVAYGAGQATGFAVALGIGLQNMPEGLAVAAAMIAAGSRRSKAFLVALASGLVEPLGGLAGAAAVSVTHALLPWGLAFAAGAMLFVISGEIVPETHQEGIERPVTFSLVAGFVLMMVLDVALA